MKHFKYRGEPVSLIALLISVFVSMGGFIFGYDIGYISGCLIMPPFVEAYGETNATGFFLSEGRQALIVSLLSVGSFTGSLLGVPCASFGRRLAIFGAGVIFGIGVIVQVAPFQVYGAFLAGRFLAGAGVGALSALVPLYQGEISPKGLRGGFTALYQIMITLGILAAYIAVFCTKDYSGSASYRVPIGIQLAWSMILCAGCPFLPKSPRESVLNNDEQTARKTIAQMHALEPEDPLVIRTLNEIKETINIQGSSSYLEVFNFRSRLKVGQRTLIGCCIQSFQQLTGANFIFYYGTSVFGSINTSLDSYISQIIYGLLDFIGTIPGLWFLDRFGRRRTMIVGALVMGCSYLLYAIIGDYALYPDNNPDLPAKKGGGAGLIFVICIFVLGYGGSWGPGGWVNTGEIAALRTKSKQLSFVAASNWSWNSLLSAFSPFIAADIGFKFGYVFFGTNLLAATFVYFFLPEMSGLSLEEIDTLFIDGISPRKSYQWNKEVKNRVHNDEEKMSPVEKASGASTGNGKANKEMVEHVQ